MTNEKYLCPACKSKVAFEFAKIWPKEPQYVAWCQQRACQSLTEGEGRTKDEAYQDLLDNYGKEKK